MTNFFIPPIEGWDDRILEDIYADLAGFAGRPVPPPTERIASIDFVHDGITWTATVGQTLRGSQVVRRVRQGRRVDVTDRHADPATVLAIFADAPYLVVTNARPFSTTRSSWGNPFMAGEPERITHFDL